MPPVDTLSAPLPLVRRHACSCQKVVDRQRSAVSHQASHRPGHVLPTSVFIFTSSYNQHLPPYLHNCLDFQDAACHGDLGAVNAAVSGPGVAHYATQYTVLAGLGDALADLLCSWTVWPIAPNCNIHDCMRWRGGTEPLTGTLPMS
jgi:hypothetical protein